jgi:hypothetical protein
VTYCKIIEWLSSAPTLALRSVELTTQPSWKYCIKLLECGRIVGFGLGTDEEQAMARALSDRGRLDAVELERIRTAGRESRRLNVTQ